LVAVGGLLNFSSEYFGKLIIEDYGRELAVALNDARCDLYEFLVVIGLSTLYLIP
jgi:hypothetical protein